MYYIIYNVYYIVNTLIEKDHLGDWSPEKELFATVILTTCAEAILRVKW